MAGYSIDVEMQNLRDVANNMGRVVTSLGNIQVAINRIRDSAMPAWEGKAAEQFSKNTARLTKKAQDYAGDIKKSKDTLEQAVTAYEATERKQVGNVGQLSTKGIF